MTRTQPLILPQDWNGQGDATCGGVRGPWEGCRNGILPKWPSLEGLVLSHTDSFWLSSHLKGKWARVGRESVHERLWGKGEIYR